MADKTTSAPEQDIEREVPFRGGGFAPTPRRFAGLVVFVLLIAFVEWGTRAEVISA